MGQPLSPLRVNADLLAELAREIGRDRLVVAVGFQRRPYRDQGWREATEFSAEQVLQSLEPYCSGFLCTYVDKEGMLQGTDLEWFLACAQPHR